MQDLGFLGPMERSQPGPAKYGGTLPAVPYIHRAEEVLVGLSTARASRDKAYAFAIVDGYIRSKKARGQVGGYISQKMELLEARIPMSFASVFIDARDWHRLPPSRIIRRRRAPSDAGPSRSTTNVSTVSSAARPQRPVSAIASAGGPSVTQMAAADRRPAVQRAPEPGAADEELPPPPYSAEDPEPEATRALQESLAAAAEQQSAASGVSVGAAASEFAPEPQPQSQQQPQHRRANSSSASMVTAPTSLSTISASSRRTSGDRPRPSDFPASPAARAGTVAAASSSSAAGVGSNGPSAVNSPAATPAVDAPAVDTSNMNDEERRAVEESQLEEAMRASRQAEKERLEYEQAVQASLAQAEEDALRRALAYPGEAPAESSQNSHRSRSGSGSKDSRSGSRSGRSSKRSSLHAPSVSSQSSDATVRRAGSVNKNKPLPTHPLPPVQEPANESLMDMLASIDFNAPDIKPIQPAPPLASQVTGGSYNSRGSISGASGASIEATVSSPQSSSNGSWLSNTNTSPSATAAQSAAPSLGTTPTQPTYIHHAQAPSQPEPKMKSNNPFLSPEDEGEVTPTVALSPSLPPRPTRTPPAPPRSDTTDTVTQQSYQGQGYDPYAQHQFIPPPHQQQQQQQYQQGEYLDPSSAHDADGGHYENWRGDAHGLTINTSPRSGTAPSLSSAGATVAHLTPSTGSHSPSGFPFPVAVPSGLPPSPRPNSEYLAPGQRSPLPPIPSSRSADSLPPPVPPPPGSHLSSSTQPVPQGLELLREYDTVFLVDDSGALAGARWEAAAHLLCCLVEAAPNGLDVYFLNSKRIGKSLKERPDVEELFAGLLPRGGGTMGARLEALLREYMARLEKDGGARKLNLVVVTDGVFAKPVLARARHARGIADLRHELLSNAPADDAESVLVAVGQRLDRGGYPAAQVGVQFVQLGDDPEARKALQELDSGLAATHGVRDMVDTVHYDADEPVTPELSARLLLGGIHRKYDWRAS